MQKIKNIAIEVLLALCALNALLGSYALGYLIKNEQWFELDLILTFFLCPLITFVGGWTLYYLGANSNSDSSKN